MAQAKSNKSKVTIAEMLNKYNGSAIDKESMQAAIAQQEQVEKERKAKEALAVLNTVSGIQNLQVEDLRKIRQSEKVRKNYILALEEATAKYMETGDKSVINEALHHMHIPRRV